MREFTLMCERVEVPDIYPGTSISRESYFERQYRRLLKYPLKHPKRIYLKLLKKVGR